MNCAPTGIRLELKKLKKHALRRFITCKLISTIMDFSKSMSRTVLLVHGVAGLMMRDTMK